MLETPVAFLIFNRPETTRRVFAEIAQARPKRLLVVADGPRSATESEKCQAARKVVEEVNWDCEILTNYSDVNLGCKRRISSGLNWVFDICEEAIILEDDCLPTQSFFRFCKEMLGRYREDDRVMMISGNNFQFGRKRGSHSYYFSCYAHIWGWASWRAAWRYYDLEMSRWPMLRDTHWLYDILGDEKAVNHWANVLDQNYQGRVDSWDIQWIFTCWVNSGLTAISNQNLVSNIGFGVDATHTKSDIYGVADLPSYELGFPLDHPMDVVRDRAADQFTFENMFARETDNSSIYMRFGRRLFAALPDPIRNSILELRARLG